MSAENDIVRSRTDPRQEQVPAAIRMESGDSVARQCRLIQDELAKDGRSR